WGRTLSIGFAIVSIILTAGQTVYSMIVLGPALKNAIKEAGDLGMGCLGSGGGPVGDVLGAAVGIASGALFPCIMLFILFLPRIRTSFAVANGDAPTDAEQKDAQGVPTDADTPQKDQPADRVPLPEDEYR